MTVSVVRRDGVELFWLPLGAGGFVVRRNGQLYELFAARREHRRAQPLFHTALRMTAGGRTQVVEMAPVWNLRIPERGVVLEGPVGARWLGRWRAFRYEVRRWADGEIPDVAEAVASPVRISDDGSVAVALLELVPAVPPLTWGRDELELGDMWNSNSLVGWLLTMLDLEADLPPVPQGGRAPGWAAGVRLAQRQRGAEAPDGTIATPARP